MQVEKSSFQNIHSIVIVVHCLRTNDWYILKFFKQSVNKEKDGELESVMISGDSRHYAHV